MKRINVILILSAVVFLVSCGSSTRVLSSWTHSDPPEGVMDKVLVLGVMPSVIENNEIEQAMTNQLNRSNVTASSAISVFGPRGFRGLTEEEITAKLKNSNFTSVMIVSLVDRERETRYIPGTFYTAPRIVGFHRFYRRYLIVYDRNYVPGHFSTNTNFVLQAEIFSLGEGDELIYSAQTRSYDPSSARALGESFARAIAGELRTQGIIR